MTSKYTKIRKIRITQSTDRGTIFTDKNQSDGFVEFESLTEEGLFLLLVHDPNCTAVLLLGYILVFFSFSLTSFLRCFPLVIIQNLLIL